MGSMPRFSCCLAAALAMPAALTSCGGDVLAVVSFIGSAGGDWVIDDPSVAGFQQRADCGGPCVINIQRLDPEDPFATNFRVSYTGTLSGCPSASRNDGTVSGRRISLPGCFTGQYVTINEALADDGRDRGYFDSETPSLAEGVWVEIQDQRRRFKFEDNSTGCELTTPTATRVDVTIVLADLGAIPPVLQTTIATFTVGGVTWNGEFVGLSGMRLVRGGEVLELERRNLTVAPVTC
jgi:hypothetical protein